MTPADRTEPTEPTEPTELLDVTGHLRGSLDAALALANQAGAADRHGRPQAPAEPAERHATVTAALRLTTRRPPELDGPAVTALHDGGARLYAALVRLAEGEQDAAAGTVNDMLRDTRATPRLVRDREAPWHLHFWPADAAPAAGWLAELATAVAMLIGSGQAGRLRRCAAARCAELFLDGGRGRPRRFCTAGCQNRTKVAAFRARTARPGRTP